MDDRMNPVTTPAPPLLLEPAHVEALISALRAQGHRVMGPVRRDHAIVYDEIESSRDLPAGWTDDQAPGSYRLRPRDDGAWFGYAAGPHAWKRFLHPPILRLWTAHRRNHRDFALEPEDGPPPRLAFLGVRPCELAAIARQDQVLAHGPFPDAAYSERRRGLFIVAVQCSEPGGTCFCASMGTGPRATAGFDIALTELVAPGVADAATGGTAVATSDGTGGRGGRHVFVAEAGSEAGAALLGTLGAAEAGAEDRAEAQAILDRARSHMGRTLDTTGLREALLQHAEHPRWEKVAARCLTCGNCTMACPTCFCTTVEDACDLTGTRAERWRKWDSCFSVEFSYMHGGSVRLSPRSRYRQWLTHKLSTWWDQFGVSGCVGCGRCITWCPVGIDLTVEAQAIRDAGAGAAADVPPQEPVAG